MSENTIRLKQTILSRKKKTHTEKLMQGGMHTNGMSTVPKIIVYINSKYRVLNIVYLLTKLAWSTVQVLKPPNGTAPLKYQYCSIMFEQGIAFWVERQWSSAPYQLAALGPCPNAASCARPLLPGPGLSLSNLSKTKQSPHQRVW